MKVIGLSGYPLAKGEELERAGFVDFIRKPFHVRTLAQAINKALKG